MHFHCTSPMAIRSVVKWQQIYKSWLTLLLLSMFANIRSIDYTGSSQPKKKIKRKRIVGLLTYAEWTLESSRRKCAADWHVSETYFCFDSTEPPDESAIVQFVYSPPFHLNLNFIWAHLFFLCSLYFYFICLSKYKKHFYSY